MSMYEAIKNFAKQFEYEPKIENEKSLRKYDKFIVAGMGGSNLIAGLLKIRNPGLEIIEHRNYDLPNIPKNQLKETLIIANSYSGNTEETISTFLKAVKEKLPIAAVSTGGKLMDLARKHKKPYIHMPNFNLQPRSATGLNIKAILKIMGDRNGLRETLELANSLRPYQQERDGKALAKKLKGHVPVIYSSQKNFPIAYNWKIKFNETGKIPAFINNFPELNHNEMTGFDTQDTTRDLSKNFFFLFLKDSSDNLKILKRMNVTERLYRERGFPVEVIILNGKTPFQKIFSSLIFADWTAYYIATEYKVEAEQVPMVEEFKKLIK
ncbi:MAG: hypothetical protein HZB99_01895 [Candidatus Harrisonbacteria bacterium]|nr:hypothetical protein [Candidatus Harrisonbacteria bacterium]